MQLLTQVSADVRSTSAVSILWSHALLVVTKQDEVMAFICARRDSDWILGNISSPNMCLGTGTGCPRKWLLKEGGRYST